jgi:hypothetical protein
MVSRAIHGFEFGDASQNTEARAAMLKRRSTRFGVFSWWVFYKCLDINKFEIIGCSRTRYLVLVWCGAEIGSRC